MSHKNNNKDQILRIRNNISALVEQLQTLAPHPGQKNPFSPYSIAHRDCFKPSDPNDALLGSLLVQSVLGGVFNQVANDNGTIGSIAAACLSHDTLIDMAEELLSSREEKDECKIKAHGRGTYALGQKNAIRSSFMQASDASAQEAFMADLPERLHIEQRLQALSEELDALYAAPYKADPLALKMA